MIRTPPLRLRNRLSETILAAVHDTEARRALRALATDGAARAAWTGAGEEAWQGLVELRARRAHEALAARPLGAREPTLGEALDWAAVLFDAGLHFEVHELLEPHWGLAGGEERQALQGLVQVAVGYQHLANGNAAGARALLDEGVRRLREGRLVDLAVEAFATAVEASLAALAAGQPVTPPRFPRRGRPMSTAKGA